MKFLVCLSMIFLSASSFADCTIWNKDSTVPRKFVRALKQHGFKVSKNANAYADAVVLWGMYVGPDQIVTTENPYHSRVVDGTELTIDVTFGSQTEVLFSPTPERVAEKLKAWGCKP